MGLNIYVNIKTVSIKLLTMAFNIHRFLVWSLTTYIVNIHGLGEDEKLAIASQLVEYITQEES